MDLLEIAINKNDTIKSSSSLEDVLLRFKGKSSYLCVLKDKKPIGVIFKKTLLEKKDDDIAISKILDKEFVAIRYDKSLEYACEMADKLELDFLILVDKKGKYLGIIKKDDLKKRVTLDKSSIKSDKKSIDKDLFSQNVIGVICVSDDMKIVYQNRYIEKFLGYEKGELDGKNLKTIVPANSWSEVFERYKSIKNSKKSKSFIQKYITKDKKQVDGLVVLSAILGDDKKTKYYLAFIQDYAKHYDSFQEIKRENSILETILNSVEDVIFFKDSNLKYRLVNKHFLSHTLLDIKDVIGKSDLEIFPKHVAKKYIQNDKRIVKNRQAESYITLWHSRETKSETECKVTLNPIFHSDGEFIGIIGNAHDLNVDKQLENRQKLIQNVFEYSAEGMIITDEDQKITAINQAFTDITGYTQDDLIGLSPKMLASGKHDRAFYMQMWKDLNEKGLWRGEIINRKKSGEEYPELLTISAIEDDLGNIINYTGIFSDISKLKETQLELEYIAHHDSLTGLQNRLSLEINIKHLIKRAKRESFMLGVLFFDLDHFKEINDTYGHSTGDKILIQVATRLKKVLRDTDILSRLGGDEFIILIEDFDSLENLEQIIQKVFHIFAYPFIVNDKIFNVTCSVGASIYPNDGDDMETLLKNADVAMYQAKKAGRNTHCLYTSEMTNALLRKVEAVSDIRRGVENNEFFLQYQPQIDIQTDKIIGTEALVRWQHPDKGLVYPDEFIQLAEKNQLIIAIGKQVLLKACMDIRRWLDMGINLENFRVAVNVSAVQLLNDDLYKTVKDITTKANISPKYLEIELTETSIMNDPDKAMELFEKFKSLSVTLSVDDFGTGYSSLSYLKKFSIHKIKIDRSFINDIPLDKDDVAITKAILALGKSMDLEVVAEGVEDTEQKSFLLKEGCTKAQGYYYAKPLYAKELEEKFLKTR